MSSKNQTADMLALWAVGGGLWTDEELRSSVNAIGEEDFFPLKDRDSGRFCGNLGNI